MSSATYSDELLGEATFIPSAFLSSHVEEGIRGFAKRLQTLMIMEPGTLPNCTEAGVGIGLYLSEFADSETLFEITTNINYQIKTYLPNDVISNLNISFIKDPVNGDPVLTLIATMNMNGANSSFALTFQDGSVRSKQDNVISNFYF